MKIQEVKSRGLGDGWGMGKRGGQDGPMTVCDLCLIGWDWHPH